MPSTVFSLVLFFCFVTPGLVFELLRERRRPARQYSALRETSIIVVASVAFTLPAAILVLLAWRAHKSWFDFSALATTPAQYSGEHPGHVIVLILSLVALASCFAWIADRLLRCREQSHAVARNNPTWFEVVDGKVRPSGTKAVLATVELKNGASIQGAIKGHETDKDQTLAWLILQSHSAINFGVTQPDGAFVEIPPDWSYSVVAGSEIRSANIAYVETEN